MQGVASLNSNGLNFRSFTPTSFHRDNHHRRRPQPSHVRTQPPTRRRNPNPNRNGANPVSLPLYRRNPTVVYKEIQQLARLDKLNEALTVMHHMDQLGVPVNATTFSALIAAAIRAKSLHAAREIHVHLRINGLERNEFLRTKLVQLYCSCGGTEDAHKLFDESPSRDMYAWNALIRGTVVAGRKGYRDVLATYSEMRALGVEMNFYTYSNVIKSFAGASSLKQGAKVHAHLVKNGFVGSEMIATCLIDMYFKCGKVRLAHKVFEEMVNRDIVVWGAMIAGFAHNQRKWLALDYVRWMLSEEISPNSVILTTILPVIGEIRTRRLGQELHAYVLKTRDYSRRLSVQSALIDMYCKCEDMVSGRRVFYESKERNAISWTALMSGYVSNGRLDQALRSVVWMQQEGIFPDLVTVATVLPVCRQLRALKHGKEVHAYAIKNLFLPNASITTSLIKMYSECGVLDYSTKLFDGNANMNLLSCTAMVDSYMKNGNMSGALSTFRSLLLTQHRPDSVVVATVLGICRETKAFILGKEIHAQALKQNFAYVPSVSAEIIKLYGSMGLIRCARSSFDAINSKGSMTWTAIIEAYGYNKLWEDAMSLFHEMISCGFTPSHFTFDVVLALCNQAELTDEACNILRLISKKFSTKLSEDHYSIVVGLLSRAGRIEEATKLLEVKHFLDMTEGHCVYR